MEPGDKHHRRCADVVFHGGMCVDKKGNVLEHLAPLRRIVDVKGHPSIPGVLIEVYECGHERRQKTDMFGPTNAYRRRCRACKANPKEKK